MIGGRGIGGKGLVGAAPVGGKLGLEDGVVELLAGTLVVSCSCVVHPSPTTNSELGFIVKGVG